MSDWPVGLSTGCFYQRSIFDCLEVISRGGFNIIEVCSFPVHLNYHDRDMVARAARRAEELGMETYSFHAPFADQAAETLNQVAECCGRLEIGCIFENKLPHLLFAHTSDLLWILATMASVEV